MREIFHVLACSTTVLNCPHQAGLGQAGCLIWMAQTQEPGSFSNTFPGALPGRLSESGISSTQTNTLRSSAQVWLKLLCHKADPWIYNLNSHLVCQFLLEPNSICLSALLDRFKIVPIINLLRNLKKYIFKGNNIYSGTNETINLPSRPGIDPAQINVSSGSPSEAKWREMMEKSRVAGGESTSFQTL